MKSKISLIIFTLAVIAACTFEPVPFTIDRELDEIIGDRAKYILPNSADLDRIPQSEANPLTKEKVDLGKFLFFEVGFGLEASQHSNLQTFACGSCHVPDAGFRPGSFQGIADGGYGFGVKGEKRIKYPTYADDEVDAQGNRPLSVLNVAFVEASMWNGSFGSEGVNEGTEDVWGQFDPGTALNHLRIGNLEAQNIEGLKVHRLLYNEDIVTRLGYKEMFDAAFPDVPVSERYNRTTASFAISAYLRALTTTEAPFQRWLRGNENAMTEQQKRGAALFFGKVGCVDCHNQPNLGSNTFHALGVNDLWERGGIKTSINDRRTLGRGGFTDLEEDMFKFRVPQLYNLGDSGPYFHGSSKETLEEVVRYFNDGIAENKRVPEDQLSYYLRPLNMTEDEIQDLTVFLKDGLRDPNLDRFVPKNLKSGMCFPNNDPWSQDDMGCE